MISLCLKSFDKPLLDKLETYFDNIDFPGILYSQKKFKNFNNLIIHYKGSNGKKFYAIFSDILSNFIIENFEENIINTSLKLDFFYFSAKERNDILKRIQNELCSTPNYMQKKSILKKAISEYTKFSNKYNLNGFINFRIYKYKNFLSEVMEKEIHNYVLQKEYSEYVNLLKEYLSIKPHQSSVIHLIYSENEKILLDNIGNIITTTGQKKYLSDISFSTNDFILNSIISLMPQKIVIHLHGEQDNFIQFLTLIFENRYTICNHCNFCKNYLNLTKKSADSGIISPIH